MCAKMCCFLSALIFRLRVIFVPPAATEHDGNRVSSVFGSNGWVPWHLTTTREPAS